VTGDCVFCGILSGDIEASFVSKHDHAAAFMDINQINAGHVLVVPTAHASQLADLSEDQAAETFRLVHRVACALPKSGVRCEGYHLAQANGAAAGQEVFHVHFHLVPRFVGDPFRISVDPARPRFSREALDKLAKDIARVM
jgi:diadenosine tetraphosphate (Ap4A) HIT family hydrolase